ncbi:MAG: sigma-54-dependent Fis family transcriptional regulator [Ignavibacteriae bacterium]|nr:sigma-54-dependent Fis family transcriptional regulator [Ignavibacteriota bacterium]
MKRKNINSARVLVVDDDEKILFAFREVLKKDGHKCIVARNGEEALDRLSKKSPDLVFMDITMPKLDGLEALKQIKQHESLLPVIIITGYGTMQTAIKAVQNGAFEYLTKPLDVEKIREVTTRAILSAKTRAAGLKEVDAFKADFVDRYELVGRGSKMQEVYKLIGSISTTPNHTSVLITGESGTGKELVARAIHANSANAKEPFVGINCTTLPESLLESELFGYEKGAFTGAADRKLGKFEIAGKGTIFLDEIVNLSPNLQQKLLRVLQERDFERLGGNTAIHAEGRFIAATNRDIDHEVKKGNFREDLFYRLNVVTTHLPPLRERKEDIPLLANYFLSKYNDHLKKAVKGFSDDAMSLLQSYSYPGNVRELENLIERAVMLTKGDVIIAETIRDKLETSVKGPHTLPIISPVFSKSREHIMNSFEKQFLVEQLSKHRGNVTAAAKASKMTRQNFHALMKKYNIRAEGFRR